MSRARPWIDPSTQETIWFNRLAKATPEQLQLLADAEAISIDDLLDEGLSQRQVLARLHELEGKIPPEVFERRAARKAWLEHNAECVICDPGQCEGEITKHHFCPRWMMLLLENYQAYASRSKCCIPVCISRHRDLHLRDDSAPKSIYQYLRTDQRAFAQKMLEELREQRPAVWEMLCQGDKSTYEGQLVQDFLQGRFKSARIEEQVQTLERIESA